MAKALTHKDRRNRRKRIADVVGRGKISVPAAAKRYGVTPQMVRLACLEHGKPVRTSRTPPLGRSAYAVLADLITTTLRPAQIAENRGLTIQYVDNVQKRAKKAGIPLKKG